MRLWRRVSDGLSEYLRERPGPGLFVLVLFVIGVIFGALAVGALGQEDKQELVRYVGSFIRDLDRSAGEISRTEILKESIWSNLKTAGFLWLLGITIVGSPGVAVIIFIRGFMIGFVVGFLMGEMGLRGLLFALVAVVPQNLLAVPAILIAGMASLSFSLMLVKSKLQRRRIPFSEELLRYSLVIMAMIGVLAASGVIEAYITPVFMRMVSGLI